MAEETKSDSDQDSLLNTLYEYKWWILVFFSILLAIILALVFTGVFERNGSSDTTTTPSAGPGEKQISKFEFDSCRNECDTKYISVNLKDHQSCINSCYDSSTYKNAPKKSISPLTNQIIFDCTNKCKNECIANIMKTPKYIAKPSAKPELITDAPTLSPIPLTTYWVPPKPVEPEPQEPQKPTPEPYKISQGSVIYGNKFGSLPVGRY